MRERVRSRPVLWLIVVAAVALLAGVGIGLSDTGQQADLEAELADLQEERDEAESALEEAEEDLDNTQSDLADVVTALGDSESDARRAEAQAERAQDQAAAEPPTAEPETTGSEDTSTIGDFTFSDVQVSEDGVGDFEIRARVTNGGAAQEFVDLQATLFSEGSVVADLEAIEDFAAGQTRTVTLISTDDFGPWDDIEFTVDAGF